MTEKRERLENVALESAQRKGLNGLSFRTLADEVGIKSSSVHYYFPEKSDLTRTLIERYTQNFLASVDSIASQNWALRKKLKAFIAIFENVAVEEKLCLCGMMAAEVEQLDDENRKLLSAFFTDTEERLVTLFTEHKDELNAELSAKVLARSLLAGLEGALLADRVVGDNHRLKAQKELFMAMLK